MTFEPVLGIDPGTKGAMVILDKSVMVKGFRPEMGATELAEDIHQALVMLAGCGGRHVFMEKVGHIPGDGPQGSFTFGRASGFVEGALHLARRLFFRTLAGGHIEIHMVPPMLWQAKLGCLSGGNKNVTKRKAQELWPEAQVGFKWTHQISDAALIARYGQMVLAESAALAYLPDAVTPFDPLAEES